MSTRPAFTPCLTVRAGVSPVVRRSCTVAPFGAVQFSVIRVGSIVSARSRLAAGAAV